MFLKITSYERKTCYYYYHASIIQLVLHLVKDGDTFEYAAVTAGEDRGLSGIALGNVDSVANTWRN